MSEKTKIQLFQEKSVRTHWDDKNEKWYFSIIDVVAILTNSNNPRRYWSDLKIKLKQEGSEVYDKIVQLKMVAADGKRYYTDCFTTEDLLRSIQSIPSPKAEPFKLWLAKVDSERIDEIEDPELAFERAMETYLKKDISCGAKAQLFCYSVNPTLKDGVISIWSTCQPSRLVGSRQEARLILRSIKFAVNNTVINLFKKLSQTYFNVVENKHNYPSIYAGD